MLLMMVTCSYTFISPGGLDNLFCTDMKGWRESAQSGGQGRWHSFVASIGHLGGSSWVAVSDLQICACVARHQLYFYYP